MSCLENIGFIDAPNNSEIIIMIMKQCRLPRQVSTNKEVSFGLSSRGISFRTFRPSTVEDFFTILLGG